MNKERYNRQILVFGEDGQKKILQSKVLIVGLGGLGAPIALYLASAGVGCLGIVDHDNVSLNNLQRQILYSEAEEGLPKVDSAEKRLAAINSEIIIKKYNLRLDQTNADEIISQYDVVVDGCDNVETRYIIDEFSSKRGIPYVYGAINACDGQVAVFNYKSGMRYSSLFPKEESDVKNSSSIPNPVLGVTPAIIGSAQAMEVIKILTEIGEVLDGKLWTYNLLNNESSCYKLT